jgi:hypothetical protein
MNAKEVKILQDYVKKRYDDVSLDFKTFNADIDTDLTYAENKTIVDKHLELVLPKKIEKPNVSAYKQQQEEAERLQQEEFKKQEAQARAKIEADMERIITQKTTEEMEKLYFKPTEYIKMVASGKEKGLLLYGVSSMGKTYRVRRVLAEQGKKEGTDYFIISGHITPLQFYCKLFYAKDKIVVFDDVNILESKINLNMLKASLNENAYGRVEYATSKKMPDGVPSSFIFTGQVIILLNDKPKNSEHLKAVESRIISYHLEFNYDEIIRIITDIAKERIDGTTQEERFEVVKWIKDNTSKATKNLNLRLYQHAIRFYLWNKECWKELASSYIQNDEYTTYIIQGLGEKEWCEKTGLGRSSYFVYKQKVGR